MPFQPVFCRCPRSLVSILVAVVLAVAACGPPPQPETATEGPVSSWESTLDRVVKGVVVLRVTVPREFDTETSGSYVGTGFVVDAQRGLILTNRHLVQPGPVMAEAVFLNHEEVDVRAVYRDPVHDFGFYQYDPSALKFAEVEEIPLAPEAARVGIEIRVVGNDAGEKLSILSGTLARLDRDAPEYDALSYNDFNTFYYQAASGTSGGSSGSPVIDAQGRAVALNAGGAFLAESSFFLPLHRVVRALRLVQAAQPVVRGTLQTVFRRQSFDELRRLGVPLEAEGRFRAAPGVSVGMLVVEQVIPGGPGDGLLEPGDVLTAVDGKLVVDFVELEERLDSGVGGPVRLSLLRGGEAIEVEPTVGDLHAITPSEFIEVGESIIHPLSYQQAKNFREPVEGLYVARVGYMLGNGVSWGAVIKEVDGVPVRTLDALWNALLSRPDRDRMRIRFTVPFDSAQDFVSVVNLDRRWFPMRRCRMEPGTGRWPCEEAPPAVATWAPEPSRTDMPQAATEPARTLSQSLVMVEYDIPYLVEGAPGAHFVGTGLVVDAKRGLVVTDRDTVPILLGDLQLTFGGTLRVPGHVEFIHPTHNFAIVSYDPAMLGDTPVRTATLEGAPLSAGEKLFLVARDRTFNLVASEATVTRVAPLDLPYPDYPGFRDSNLDAIELGGATHSVGGVLADANGKVRALWLSFGFDQNGAVFRGLPIGLVESAAGPLRAGETPVVRSLGVELRPLNLADAREEGLSNERSEALRKAGPDRQQALFVARRYSGFPAETSLEGGDIVLTANGKVVTSFEDVERASQQPRVTLEVLRDGSEQTIDVETVELPTLGVTRVVSWAGLIVHAPHLEVAMQRSTEMSGVYIAWSSYGSPATHYGIGPGQRIVEVDGKPVPDLDAFVEAVGSETNRTAVRLKLVDLEGLERMVTLKVDLEFWPSWVLAYDGKDWTRSTVGPR